MSNFVVWLDSEKAQIFNLTASGIKKHHVTKSKHDHHTHNKKDHHGDPAIEHFLHEIATALASADALLILGPAQAKFHFKTHLETHHKDLSKKVIGVASSDHPSDNQIIESARPFFKTYELFGVPVSG